MNGTSHFLRYPVMFHIRSSTLRRLQLVAVLTTGLLVPLCRGQSAYNFGNPTAEEQYYFEMVNRARANPAAEGVRLAATTDANVLLGFSSFAVNLTLMKSEFSALPVAPPIVPNAILMGTARSHSAWMLAHATQSHNETNPANDPFTRMTTAGYSWSSAGENIYAYSKSLWYGHAGFQVDWGTGGTGGMISGRGHRANIHSAKFREMGVGISFGTNGAVGPQVITQDFGNRANPPTFGTGVAYYDLNANNAYDAGEGISGLTVNVSGTSDYCTTAAGGGWVVPVPIIASNRTVTFSGLGMNQTVALAVPASTNAKADLKLTYVPPAVTSPATGYAGTPYTLVCNPVGGASSYKWNRWTSASAAVENCDSTTNITSSTTGTYSVLCTTLKQQGTASFHLATPTPVSQSIQLKGLYYANASPSVSFQSRVGYAMTTEHFKLQVKEEGGDWLDAYDQAGSGGAGEASTFHLRSASLTAMVGKAFRVRFLLSYTSGGYYSDTGSQAGWLVDAITFTNVATLGNNAMQVLTAPTGNFTPGTTGSYVMAVSPMVSGRDYKAAYKNLTVGAAVAPAITANPVPATIISGASATLTVVASGSLPTYQWYVGNKGVTTRPISGATSPSYTTPALTATTTYWAMASNSAGTANSNAASVTVNPTFASWAASYEGGNVAVGTISSDPNGDFDHDGRPNLVEYAFGASPVTANDSAPRMPTARCTATDLVISYQIDTSLTDIAIVPQVTTDLGSWRAPGVPGAPAGFIDTLISTAGTVQTREAKVPLGAGRMVFMRMTVTSP